MTITQATKTQATKTQVQQWVERKEQQSPPEYKISLFKTRAVTWALNANNVGYLIAALNLPSKQSPAFRYRNRQQTSSRQLSSLFNQQTNENTSQDKQQFIDQLTKDPECHTDITLTYEPRRNTLINHYIIIGSNKHSQGGWCAKALDLKKLAHKYDTKDSVRGLFSRLISQDNSAHALSTATNRPHLSNP